MIADFTPISLISYAPLEEIRRVRAQGYAIGDQEIELGLRIIAMPIRDAAGRVLAAMSLAARTSRVARDAMLKKMLPALEAGRRSLASVL